VDANLADEIEGGDVMKKHGVCFRVVLVLSMLIVEGFASYAYSQERLSDKDVKSELSGIATQFKKDFPAK
jgi:hypothetical protein